MIEQPAEQYRVIKRRSALIGVIVAAVVFIPGGLAVIRYTENYLALVERVSRVAPERALEEAMFLFRWIMGSAIVMAFASAAYLAWYGYRVIKTERNPPPGSWIIEHQRIATGRRARRGGYAQLAAAVLLVVGGIGLGWAAGELADQLVEGAGAKPLWFLAGPTP
ncbi:MAG: hypothetical protein GWN84_11500 [Gammaproteobacteria bacterium]|nr:hypothetical protein [Gammaproteobacteria bacterium]NIR83491.1 hypothetical protein [Gammaproteobacteria bacterium]NIR91413.1 hypothetical protein [Gammaproteobacteria bacterium]NIU04653.1 hypothetical protein [Gammaproteobacteria bacterium]NIV51695.1 hypothetical protein [Gammaproteobacteria bacterium]